MQIRKTDLNHKEIIDKLRQIPNLSVFSTHTIGKGFPDIVIGYKDKNYLVEIKSKKNTIKENTLTPAEMKFFLDWKGQYFIAYSFEQVLNMLNI